MTDFEHGINAMRYGPPPAPTNRPIASLNGFKLRSKTLISSALTPRNATLTPRNGALALALRHPLPELRRLQALRRRRRLRRRRGLPVAATGTSRPASCAAPPAPLAPVVLLC